uniref:Reverse transcriptase domain-containing protein n=1 Tax=Tanacetum cinerariifolium TaxID=118510 RepID=A0A6L2ND87_TANCI|nr:reverse transcriptase domain-containing protein [Tanacetum cinerariifolium]
MEPRPEQTREVTSPLRTRSPLVHKQRERVVGFEEAPNREGTRTERNTEGSRPLKAGAEENGRQEMNLTLLLAAQLGRNKNGQPLQSLLTSQKRFTKTHLAVNNIKQREGESVGALTTRGITLKDKRNPLGTTTWDRKIETDSYLTEDLITGCSLSCLKAQKKSSPQGGSSHKNSISKNLNFEGREITFPPVTNGNNSSEPVIITTKIFRREEGWVYMDSGSSCEVIYKQCFLKLNPSIQAFKVDSQVLLVGFLREKYWAIREVLLEVTIGDAPLSRNETLNFVIVRSNSPYNMLLGRTTMQKMGMVVSTIHGPIKFYTTKGIETMFSTHESDKIDGETSPANTEGVLSCTNTEEKIIVSSKYLE